MICSLIKSLHREEKEVNYKVLPNLLIEKTTPGMDSFVRSELVPSVLHTGVIFLLFYYVYISSVWRRLYIQRKC